jgi:hypothetical protein
MKLGFCINPDKTVARKSGALPRGLPCKEDGAIVGWLLNVLPDHRLHLPNDSGCIEKVTKRSICVKVLGNGVAVVGDEM